MPVDVLTLPLSSMNTKWKEPYASASLNSKLTGVIAPGIYRGLVMAPDPLSGDRTVLIKADATSGDHVAVYQNSSGYSVTYRDATSGDITISLASYSNVTVIVCVFVNYLPGVDTTGSFRVFTQAEFNILTADVRNALVILGSVAVPVSGVISSSAISLQLRTLASSNLASGTILNAPLVRNPGFELGETNATYAKSSVFWDKAVTVGSGTWKTSTSIVNTGSKSIEFNVTSLPITGELSQQIGVETAEGELFLISVSIEQLKTVSSGTISLFLEWADVNEDILSTTTLSLDGGIDASFREVSTIVAAPAGASSLRRAGIKATALSPSSTGVFAYIDNVNVFVVPRDTKYPYPFDQAVRRNISARGIMLGDPLGDYADIAALLRFDKSTPSSEGTVSIERKDQNSAALPPAIALLGRILSLGSGLVATETDALKARVAAPYGVAAGIDYTLIWESVPVSGTTSPMRWYVSSTGVMVWTVNAKWNSPTANQWNKDTSGTIAYKFQVSGADFSWQLRDASLNTSWLDSGWDAQRVFRPVSDTSPNYIEEVRDATSLLRYAVRPVVPANSVEPVLQIVDKTGQLRFVVDHLGFPNQRILTRTFWWDQPFGGAAEIGWTYTVSGTGANIITGNQTPTYGAGGNNLAVVTGTANTNNARAVYTPFLFPLNNNSLTNLLVVVSWSVHIYDPVNRTIVMGMSQGGTFTPGSTDFIGFSKTAAQANFQVYTSGQFASTTGDSGVPVNAGSEFQMRIEYQGSGYDGGYAVRFFINDALIATHTSTSTRPINNALGFLFRADNTGVTTQSTAFLVTPMTLTFTPQDNLTGRKV